MPDDELGFDGPPEISGVDRRRRGRGSGEIAGRDRALASHDRPNVARVDSAGRLGRIPGLHGAHRRARGSRDARVKHPAGRTATVEFVTMSLWDSLDAIRAFAGDNLEVVFYDEDDRFLVDRERFVTHYEIGKPRRALEGSRRSIGDRCRELATGIRARSW